MSDASAQRVKDLWINTVYSKARGTLQTCQYELEMFGFMNHLCSTYSTAHEILSHFMHHQVQERKRHIKAIRNLFYGKKGSVQMQCIATAKHFYADADKMTMKQLMHESTFPLEIYFSSEGLNYMFTYHVNNSTILMPDVEHAMVLRREEELHRCFVLDKRDLNEVLRRIRAERPNKSFFDHYSTDILGIDHSLLGELKVSMPNMYVPNTYVIPGTKFNAGFSGRIPDPDEKQQFGPCLTADQYGYFLHCLEGFQNASIEELQGMLFNLELEAVLPVPLMYSAVLETFFTGLTLVFDYGFESSSGTTVQGGTFFPYFNPLLGSTK